MVTHVEICLTTGDTIDFNDDRPMIEVRDLLAKKHGWFKGSGPAMAIAIRRSLIAYVLIEVKIQE